MELSFLHNVSLAFLRFCSFDGKPAVVNVFFVLRLRKKLLISFDAVNGELTSSGIKLLLSIGSLADINRLVSLSIGLKDDCALQDMTSADICCHLMKCLYHGLLSPPIFAFEFKFMSHLKRFYNEKENPFFSAFRVFRGRLLCAGAGACWHQRSHKHADLVFRSGNQTVLCHRRGAWAGRGYQDLQQVFKRRSRYQQDGGQLVFRLYIFDCGRHYPAFLLPLGAMEYEINKGAGNPLEFKGLKSQYLFIFAGGLVAVLLVVVILYIAGVNQWICIPFGLLSGSLLVWLTFRLNARYGEHGLMKLLSGKRHPRYLIHRRRLLRLLTKRRKK